MIDGLKGKTVDIYYYKVNVKVTYTDGREPWTLEPLADFHDQEEDKAIRAAFEAGLAWMDKVKKAIVEDAKKRKKAK